MRTAGFCAFRTRDAGDGAGGAHGADEVRDAAVRVVPDLGAGGFVVHTRVVGIGKLVQHTALAFALHLLGQVAGVLHAAAARGEDQFGTKGLHGLRALDGQVLGHDQHHAVAADRSGHGQRDAGVAAGGLDQHIAGRISPRSSARRIMLMAGRSFTEPAGLLPSSLPRMTLPRAAPCGTRQALQAHQRRAGRWRLPGSCRWGVVLAYGAVLLQLSSAAQCVPSAATQEPGWRNR
jgi:hypothetical protein